MADQTKVWLVGILKNVPLGIGRVQFLQDFVVLQPSIPYSFLVFLGCPWLYAAKVQVNWKKQKMTFGHPKVTISWADVLYEGEHLLKKRDTPLTS